MQRIGPVPADAALRSRGAMSWLWCRGCSVRSTSRAPPRFARVRSSRGTHAAYFSDHSLIEEDWGAQVRECVQRPAEWYLHTCPQIILSSTCAPAKPWKCWASRAAKAGERISTPVSIFRLCAASVKFAEETNAMQQSTITHFE